MRRPILASSRTAAAAARRRLRADRKGSIVLALSLTLPAVLAIGAMSISVADWAATQQSTQRIADIASLAGAMNFVKTANPQMAATAALQVAQINGASPAAATWNAATGTLSNGQITVQIVNGVQSAANKAINVAVSRQPMSFLTSFVKAAGPTQLTGKATAELITTGGGGGQPCLVALDRESDDEEDDITVTGNGHVVSQGCTIRSNSSISMSGSGEIDADEVYAAGSIPAAANGTHHSDDGEIDDPYATDSAVQDAIGRLSSGGINYSLTSNGSDTLTPGTYQNIAVGKNSTVTASPGLYVVNGDLTLGANASLSGSGVTFVVSGNVQMGGNCNVALSAPAAHAASGVPGMTIIKSGAGSVSMGGNGSTAVTGVIYAPKAALTLTGNSSSSVGCQQFIVGKANLTGNATLGASCSGLGTRSFGSAPSTTTPRLVL